MHAFSRDLTSFLYIIGLDTTLLPVLVVVTLVLAGPWWW